MSNKNAKIPFTLPFTIVAKDLWPWKRLLWLESKHGPVPGTKSKVFLLIKLLDQV